MKNRYWILLLALLLVACGGLSIWLSQNRQMGSAAEIRSDGKLIKTVDLNVDQEFTVEYAGGSNLVVVKDGKIGICEATCPDHRCVQRGMCSGGLPIICLPNKLVISFVEQPEVDGAVG